MGASLALAGLGGVHAPAGGDRSCPYVRAPEEIVPGEPLFFATAMPLGGVATGVLVESHMGRPTKVEGNPEHPASLGATDAFAQASVLGLYDPDRSQVVTSAGEIRPWSAFVDAMRGALASRSASAAAPACASSPRPSPRRRLAAAPARAADRAPRGATWHQYEPRRRATSARARRPPGLRRRRSIPAIASTGPT